MKFVKKKNTELGSQSFGASEKNLCPNSGKKNVVVTIVLIFLFI